MKTLARLVIHTDKLLKNSELKMLRGGYGCWDCSLYEDRASHSRHSSHAGLFAFFASWREHEKVMQVMQVIQVVQVSFAQSTGHRAGSRGQGARASQQRNF